MSRRRRRQPDKIAVALDVRSRAIPAGLSSALAKVENERRAAVARQSPQEHEARYEAAMQELGQ